MKVFIVGVGRSGTSLLQSMLAAHPQVASAPETGFIRRHVRRGPLWRATRSNDVGGVINLLEGDKWFKRTGIEAREMVLRAASSGELTPGGLYRIMWELIMERQGGAVQADKDPRVIECLPVLAKVWPDCHVIHVMREPRDVLCSKKRSEWSRHRSVYRHVFAGRVQLRMGRELGPKWYGGRYHEVRYEDLVASPEGELRQICREVGLDYRGEMVDDFGHAAAGLVAAEEEPWKKNTMGPLIEGNSGKWQAELTESEIALAKALCGEGVTLGDGGAGHANSIGAQVVCRIRLYLVWCAVAACEPIYRLYRRQRSLLARKCG